MAENAPLLGGEPAAHINTAAAWKKYASYAGIGAVLVLGGAATWYFVAAQTSVSLASSVKIDNTFSHLENLYEIAQKFPQSSRSVLNGYNASVEYVASTLRANTDYDVEVQTFDIPFFRDVKKPTLTVAVDGDAELTLSATSKTYVADVDFATLSNAGSGAVSAPLHLIRGGCTADDYKLSRFRPGHVVIFSRDGGPCTYRVKVNEAINAKASAILMYTSGIESTPVLGRCVNCTETATPGLGLTPKVGTELVELLATVGPKGLRVTLSTEVEYVNVPTSNVIATTKAGRDDKIVVAGSHLDSVPAGPGMNDDGSGTAATLEVALSLYRTGLSNKVVNKVRFAWWAAEELGLLGSFHYVRDLKARNPEELAKIVLNLNDDMLASPNGIRAIYNGRNPGPTIDPKLAGPSGVIQEVFEGWFDFKGLTHETTEFDGRSDYGGFLEVGVPAGGLFTGAEAIKTYAQARKFGGIAGSALDPCYHQPCDDLDNVSTSGKVFLEQMSEALAYAVQRFAFEKDIDALLRGEIPVGSPARYA
ncbi:hypothetical protein BJ742DRAFT_800770 [Cladochytrium replicatum]|nr:hypothetical protein BJ742DRAFT_800770 [Cladochytrium replicatum]